MTTWVGRIGIDEMGWKHGWVTGRVESVAGADQCGPAYSWGGVVCEDEKSYNLGGGIGRTMGEDVVGLAMGQEEGRPLEVDAVGRRSFARLNRQLGKRAVVAQVIYPGNIQGRIDAWDEECCRIWRRLGEEGDRIWRRLDEECDRI